MKIGIPKEVKNHEYRVGATPGMVRVLIEKGHQVVVQKDAGTKIGFSNEDYAKAGAILVDDPQEVYEAEMIIKVKEPQTNEFALLHKGQILFCYLHLAPDPLQTAELLEKKVVGIAYETVTDSHGGLPLLVPASEIAGRISIQVGANYLQLNHGGRGVLLGGVPGVKPASVVVLGGGVAGTEAVRMAIGLGADVTVVDNQLKRLKELDLLFGPTLKTLFSSSHTIEELLMEADLVIGAVLIPGKVAPRLITREMVKKMKPGSVIVDLAIDQGGCSETSRPTTHTDPTYFVDGVQHYCVTNMPGACGRTATLAITNATMNYALDIANKGWHKALKENPYLRAGLNVCLGHVTNASLANELGYELTPFDQLLKGES